MRNDRTRTTSGLVVKTLEIAAAVAIVGLLLSAAVVRREVVLREGVGRTVSFLGWEGRTAIQEKTTAGGRRFDRLEAARLFLCLPPAVWLMACVATGVGRSGAARCLRCRHDLAGRPDRCPNCSAAVLEH